jgi:transcriptional regulator with XRE-family HTH domain
MFSQQKTTVAVLRALLGLTVAQFAELIGKSVSTVNKLEVGLLALSEETAFRIKNQTGVSVAWLLNGNSKQKPYVERLPDGSTVLYTKERFERIQAGKLQPDDESQEKTHYDRAIMILAGCFNAYLHAQDKGEGDLAEYVMRNFVDEFVTRFGKDTERFIRIMGKGGIIRPDGRRRFFVQAGDGVTLSLMLDKPAKK